MIAALAAPPSSDIRAQLLTGVRAGAAAANDRGEPVIVAIGLTAPADRDPLALFASAAAWTGERFFWEQPSRGVATAALGVTATIETHGRSRFADANERAARLFADLIHAGDAGAPVRLVGGFAFAPEGAGVGRWREFPAGLLVLPALLYHREGDRSSLTVCRRVRPDADADAIAAAIERSVAFAFGAAGCADHSPPCSGVLQREERPEAASWKAAVADAVAAVRAERLKKVVLARSLAFAADRPFADATIAERLRAANPTATTFVAARRHARFLGATPELLVRLRGCAVETTALAGSIGRGANAGDDDALAAQLLASTKDRIEHEVVVETILAALSPVCTEVRRAAGTPRIERSRSVQHLATPIAGTLAPGCTALDLVGRLHPTPAVGGAPRREALAFIHQREDLERGWYAGPIGWLDADGDGEFVVALRSGLIEGREATLFAGCGIVAASDPDAEYRETALKFGPMLGALGPA
ncbi:MAG TPA: isochorismate synthase [Thermomicrobiales bacterium]|nr:isochorismate synthase [Thermomicrobiales bacterium]